MRKKIIFLFCGCLFFSSYVFANDSLKGNSTDTVESKESDNEKLKKAIEILDKEVTSLKSKTSTKRISNIHPAGALVLNFLLYGIGIGSLIQGDFITGGIILGLNGIAAGMMFFGFAAIFGNFNLGITTFIWGGLIGFTAFIYGMFMPFTYEKRKSRGKKYFSAGNAFLINSILPFGIGSFIQGDIAIGITQTVLTPLGIISFIFTVFFNNILPISYLGTIQALISISSIILGGSWLTGVIAPFIYEKRKNNKKNVSQKTIHTKNIAMYLKNIHIPSLMDIHLFAQKNFIDKNKQLFINRKQVIEFAFPITHTYF